MGNRWSSQVNAVPVINPPEFPHLHISSIPSSVPVGSPNSDAKHAYTYVPSVGSGLDTAMCVLKNGKKKDDGVYRATDFQRLSGTITVPILPPIEQVPPPPISTSERIEAVVDELFDSDGKNLGGELAKHPGANALMLSCGVKWGLLPVDAVVQRLQSLGYGVSHFAQVGRAHRIPDYILFLSRR